MKHHIKLLPMAAFVAMMQVACSNNDQPAPPPTTQTEPAEVTPTQITQPTNNETQATTENATADDAQKSEVIKGFLDCNLLEESTCTTVEHATNPTKAFLSVGAVAALESELSEFNPDEDCSANIPRCYSGLWTIPGQDWDSEGYKNTLKITPSSNPNELVATYKQLDGTIEERVYFKVVNEGGQWKIDNTTRAFADNPTQWWR